ncbi:CpaD family pilus assembly protein [Oryzifoliimicrobium ureilyticus]|uniref:CpaD family pilus assembly protein n=1 Tax=Oryzifoliimicrobium ureilyticus TaxID=3113724 RepID=UPI003F67B703
MTKNSSRPKNLNHIAARRSAIRIMPLVAIIATSAVLTGCNTERDTMTTGGIPDDYRQRHPIVVAEAQQATDLPVASTDRRLTMAQRDLLRGFVQSYRSRASGPVYLMTPSGSPNARAAAELRPQVRSELIARGIPSSKIVYSGYQAAGPQDAAPIRLSFTAITAMTSPCGQWPKDINADMVNQNYYNFGCATQNNLAAQVANPEDLIAPRGMTAIDADRREAALKEYRERSTVLKDTDTGNAGGF